MGSKTWVGFAAQITKVKTVFTKLSPPEPDDNFEALRADVLKQFDKLSEYVAERAASE